ncbi:MAG: DUF945 family protein [Pseudomonadota bacterium]
MRKLTLTFSALLIIVALAGPAITGHYTENMIRDGQPFVVDGLPDWLELVEHSYDRGWFGADASHRLLVTDPERAGMLREWLDDGDFGDQPAIVMNSRVTHGILVNLFTPAFARSDSRFVIDGGEQTHPLPAMLRTTIGLGGTTTFVVQFADGELQQAGDTFGWSNAHIDYVAKPIANQALVVTMHADTLKMTAQSGQDIRLDRVDAALTLSQQAGAMAATIDYQADVPGDPITSGELNGTVVVNKITRNTLIAVQTLASALTDNSGAAMMTLNDNIDVLRNGFAQPVDLRWEHVLTTADGPQNIELTLTTAALAGLPSTVGPQALINTLIQNSQTEISAKASALFLDGVGADAPQLAEQITMLKGMGALIGNDENGYSMKITSDQGVINVNGSPLPTFAPQR